MNTKDNQRTRISLMLFRNALTDLIKEKKDINKITVKELCGKAGLNRSTFYAHYETPKDVMNSIENDILDATVDFLNKISEEVDTGAHKYIVSFLKFIKDNDNVFRLLLVDSFDPEFRSKFMNISICHFIADIDVPVNKEYEQFVFSFLIDGSMGVIQQWIRSGYSISENEVASVLFRMNKNSLAEEV